MRGNRRADPGYWDQPRCEVCGVNVTRSEADAAVQRHDKVRCRRCLRLHQLVTQGQKG